MPINPAAARTCDSIRRETIYPNIFQTVLSGAGLCALYTLVDKSNPAVPTYVMGTLFAERCISLISSITSYALMDTSDATPQERRDTAERLGIQEATPATEGAELDGSSMLHSTRTVPRPTTSVATRSADQAVGDRINTQVFLNRYNKMYKKFYNGSCTTVGAAIGIGILGNKENRNSFCNLFSTAG